jgi:hypothetical protein
VGRRRHSAGCDLAARWPTHCGAITLRRCALAAACRSPS